MVATDFPAWYSAGVFGGIGCALLSAMTIAAWSFWRRRGVSGQVIGALLVCVVASALDIGPLLWIENRLNVYGPTLSPGEVGSALLATALCGWAAPLAAMGWYVLLATPITVAPVRAARPGAVSPASLDDPARAQAVYRDGQPWGPLILEPSPPSGGSAEPAPESAAARPIALTTRLTLIGRELDNDIVLDDDRVSRRHAELRWDHGRIELADYGSLNGTLVNQQAVRGRLLLRDGDILDLGERRYRLALQVGEARDSQPDLSRATSDAAVEGLETRKTASASGSFSRQRQGLRLKLLQGGAGAAGASWLITAAVTTIGRDPSCGISLADTSISRIHAQITRQPAGYFIADLQSSNGVSLNGQRLTGPAQIFAGDIVTLGDCLLRCEEVAADAPNAPAASAAEPAAEPATPPAEPAPSTVAMTPTGAPSFHMRISPLWSARRDSRPRLAPPRLRPTPPQSDTPQQ